MRRVTNSLVIYPAKPCAHIPVFILVVYIHPKFEVVLNLEGGKASITHHNVFNTYPFRKVRRAAHGTIRKSRVAPAINELTQAGVLHAAGVVEA